MYLLGLITLPLFILPSLFTFKKANQQFITSLFFSILHVAFFIYLGFKFDFNSQAFQFLEEYSFLNFLGINLEFGIDRISYFIIGAMIFMSPLFILGKNIKEFNPYSFPVFFIYESLIIALLLSVNLGTTFLLMEACVLCYLTSAISNLKESNELGKNLKRYLIVNGAGAILFLSALIVVGVLYKNSFNISSFNLFDLAKMDISFSVNTVYSTQGVLFFTFLLALILKMGFFPFHNLGVLAFDKNENFIQPLHTVLYTGSMILIFTKTLIILTPLAAAHYAEGVYMFFLLGVTYFISTMSSKKDEFLLRAGVLLSSVLIFINLYINKMVLDSLEAGYIAFLILSLLAAFWTFQFIDRKNKLSLLGFYFFLSTLCLLPFTVQFKGLLNLLLDAYIETKYVSFVLVIPLILFSGILVKEFNKKISLENIKRGRVRILELCFYLFIYAAMLGAAGLL